MAGQKHSIALWIMLLALVLIILFGALPLVVALASGVMADVLGCKITEGGAPPCIWNGHDIGETLVLLLNLGWISFLTIPIALVALVIWAIVAIVLLVVHFANRPSPPPNVGSVPPPNVGNVPPPNVGNAPPPHV
jgi:hypothetical protein